MGTKVPEAARNAGELSRIIPMNSAQTRANARKVEGIVIPVVVGSSPISHPKEHRANSAQHATKPVALYDSPVCEIPTVGILA